MSLDRQWDYDLGKYVNRTDGTKKLEVSNRTGLEDVTCVDAVAKFFRVGE